MYEDLVKAGVIDPTKVTRTALQNAASVATLLLTSDALVAEKPKEEKNAPPCPAAAKICIEKGPGTGGQGTRWRQLCRGLVLKPDLMRN